MWSGVRIQYLVIINQLCGGAVRPEKTFNPQLLEKENDAGGSKVYFFWSKNGVPVCRKYTVPL
jgi:hypothetical protein